MTTLAKKQAKQPADKQELREFKRKQLASSKDRAEIIEQPKNCFACNGSGEFSGLFIKKAECATCEGSGYDLSDPIAVIRYQAQKIKQARIHYRARTLEVKRVLRLFSKEEVLSRAEYNAVTDNGKGKLD